MRINAFLSLGLIAVTTLLLAVSDPGSAAEYPPVDVPMPLHKVSDRVYYVQGKAGIATDNAGFISNAGFVVTGAGVVVFDTLGSPSLAEKLLGQIRTVTDQEVVKVVLSHYHADHIYGLQVLKDLGAEIIAPAGALNYLDSEAAESRLDERRVSLYPWVNEQTRLTRPDVIIDRDTRLEIGDVSLQLTYLGAAHSDGDLTMYVEPDRVLFSGDIIFEGRIPFVGNADTRRWTEALDTMGTAGLSALVPGHGPAATDPSLALQDTREYLGYLREVMGRAVEEMQDFASAYDSADWSKYESRPAFDATNRRNAYQVYLSMERESFAAE